MKKGLPAVDKATLRERRRFAARRVRGRLLAWRYVLIGLALVVLVSFGVWALYFSGWMNVEKADVVGASPAVPAATIEKAAAVPVGSPLAGADLGAVRLRVLQQVPAVQNVDVTREWPNAVRIAVTLRTPVAVVQIGSTYQAVDGSGTLFLSYKTQPATLPLIRASDPTDQRALGQAAAVAGSLPDQLRGMVAYVEVGGQTDVRLKIRKHLGGAVVIWGSADDTAQKAENLATMMKKFSTATLYDVSVLGSPSYCAQATCMR